MSEPRGDTMIYPKMLHLSADLCTEIRESGLPEPCMCGPLPGANVAWDTGDCDGDGMAWVRLVNAGPFPPQAAPTPCGTRMAFTLEMGVVRTFEMPEDGEAPSDEEYLAMVKLQAADMAAMRRAVCRFLDRDEDYQVALGPYLPQGPNGGMVGGTWQLSVVVE